MPSLSARATWIAGVGLAAPGLAAELAKLGTPDMGFLLYAASRVLDGARLYRDVVEINPPLIIAFNLVVVKLARATGLPEFLVYRLGSTLLVGALVVYAGRLIRRYVFPRDAQRARYLLILWCFALLTFVRNDLGQREHFVLAFLTPYILLVAGEIGGRRPSPLDALAIGALAGIAVGLKPSFLVVWLVLEGVRRARLSGPARWRPTPEACAFAATGAVHLFVVWRVTPEYLTVASFLGPAYVRYMREPLANLLVSPGAPLVAFAILAFLALRHRMQSRELGALLAWSTVACFAGGAAQGKNFHYHYYPAMGVAFVLLGLVAADGARGGQRLAERVYSVASRAVLLTIATVVLGSAVMDAAGGGPGRREQRRQFRELADEVHARADGHPVAVLSHTISSGFPLINYAGVESASRFPSLWLLAAVYWDPIVTGRAFRYHSAGEMDPVEGYFLTAVREDLLHAQPRLLIVLRPARDMATNGQRRLDYVRYLSRDPQIAALLAEFRLAARHGEYLYYERRDGAGAGVSPLMYGPGTQDLVHLELAQVRLGQLDRESVVGLAVLIGWMLLIGIGARGRSRA